MFQSALHDSKVAFIDSENPVNIQPLGCRNDGGVNQPQVQSPILNEQLTVTDKIRAGRRFYGVHALNQVVKKIEFGVDAEVLSQEIVDFGETHHGNDDGPWLRFQYGSDGFVVAVAGVVNGIDGARISD
jgi:hypothetical protein